MNLPIEVVIGVFVDFAAYFSFKTKLGRIRFTVVALMVVAAIVFANRGDEVVEEVTDVRPLVTVGTIASFDQSGGISFIGSVESVSESRIQTEAGGRVVRVNTELGARVQAGSVIAQLENAGAYAAVLQAEGVYDAAVANASAGDISLTQAQSGLVSAQNAVVTAERSAYSTVSNAFYGTLNPILEDDFFDSGTITLNAAGMATARNEGEAFLDLLPAWNTRSVELTPNDNLASALSAAKADTERTIRLVDTVINVLNAVTSNRTVQGKTLNENITNLTAARTSLNATLASLDAATVGLQNAQDTIAKAQLGGTNSDVSAANAQVKQALGSLRAAQANLAKSIIRTPISGTVNELSIKAGDFVGVGNPVALIANNDALLITTFVGEQDLSRLTVGQSVMINNSIPGTVSAIAPAIDSVTRKTEIKISTDATDIMNGDTVTISLPNAEPTDVTPVVVAAPLVPIEAVRFSGGKSSMLAVENGVLVALPITIGPIVGSTVTVTEGIDSTTEFVLDARGLTTGTVVDVATR